MKKILLILTAFLFALSSCVHLGDLELEPVPDIAFTYTQNSGLEFTFTSSVEGTTNVGWEVIGIEGATATGDSFTYNFPEPGTYWVRMTGTYNGGEQTFTGKIAVDWAATISFKDGSLDDWDLVTKPEYVFHGGDVANYPTQTEPILIEGKFDYDANYIYVYASFDVTARADINVDSHRFDFYLDVDANTSTGNLDMGDRLGVEYIIQANFFNDEEGSFSVMDGSWETPDNAADLAQYILIGDKNVEGDIASIEFKVSRADFGITGTKVGIGLKIENNDWTDFDALLDKDGNQGIVLDFAK